jgi:DNA-binding response OmpR family regulator
MRLLVAGSDEALGAFLRRGLEAERYSVEVARDGAGAKGLAAAHEFDLVILDLNLPGLDGMDVLRHLRSRNASLPILILKNKSRVEDRVRAFDEGADDFLVMPFAFSELSARVRALLRRGRRGAEPVLRADDLELDRLARIVRRGGRRIALTPKEYGVLEFLMTHMGQRVTRPMIIENVWNFSGETMTNVVDVYINYLRKKIDVGAEKRLIHTIRGVGYELAANGMARAEKSPDRMELAGGSES